MALFLIPDGFFLIPDGAKNAPHGSFYGDTWIHLAREGVKP
jgi:hypothetical protein